MKNIKRVMPKKEVSNKIGLSPAKDRAKKALLVLCKDYPDATVTLDFTTPLELLVATILSAQCTDVRVNALTKTLFVKYRSPKDYATADIKVLEQDIRPAGFYHNKAKSIQGCCKALLEKHGGRVPDTMEELVELPGVGRKTANVLLGGYHHRPAVIVDTHVIRLSQRLGLTDESDPVKIEFALRKLLPESDWTFFSHGLILHGRRVCKALKPNCPGCSMKAFCPSSTTRKV
jgi:endonuclease-3